MFNIAMFGLGLLLTVWSLLVISNTYLRIINQIINKINGKYTLICEVFTLSLGLLLIKLFWNLAVWS